MASIEERFWAKVDKSGDCWLWTASKFGSGYGQFKQTHTWNRRAHRVAYELVKGPIPEGLTLDHLCEIKHCVNPDHLEAVPAKVNTLRAKHSPAYKNAQKTHCPKGHPYSGDNLYITKSGTRSCRACQRAAQKAWKDRQRGGPALPANKTKTHCPRGHPYDEANTYTGNSRHTAHRQCRACKRLKQREYRSRKRLA